MTKGNFYDLEGLMKTCVRTFLKKTAQDSSQTGLIYSEGCYRMEIINYSTSQGVDFTIGDESVHLERGVDLDPTAGRRYYFDRLILPGHPALVRSDIIKYTWEGDEPDHSLCIIRHMVVKFNENVKYPVYSERE